VAGAKNLSLAELPKKLASLEKSDWHLICLGGYRSSMAASLLLKEGFTDIVCTEGGTDAWKSEGLPLTVESQSVACTSPKSSCS
jgi:rhodanese-related sulfurtransferase